MKTLQLFFKFALFECQHQSKNGPFKTSFNGLKIHINNKVLCILSINKKYVRVFSVDKDSWNGGGGGVINASRASDGNKIVF